MGRFNREKNMRSSRTVRKISALVLVFIMAATVLTGCGSGGSSKESNEAPGTIISETDNDFVMVDMAGREVTLKKNPESIAICYRVVTRVLLSLGMRDKITGIGQTDKFIDVLAPEFKDCSQIGLGVADVEAVAELGPDLYFGNATDIEGLDTLEEVGIPAVGISIETPEEIVQAIDVMGKACGKEERAGELIEYYNSQLAESDELVAGIDEKDKKTAIVMGSSIGKVADGSMLQGRMLEHAGAVNCAAELEAAELWPTAGTEQIFAWNPEYIFLTNSSSSTYSREDIMNDPAWADVKAVKNNHVYLMPSDLDSWEFPGVVSALGIDFMISKMYPDLMTDQQLEENKDEFYQMCYDRTFSREELGY